MIRQYGVLAWKRGDGGRPVVLLVTSRGSGRWVPPRGHPIAGLPPHLAAAREAFEEAGVRGRTSEAAAGDYGYRKRLFWFLRLPARVTLFPLAVEEELPDWPEARQRTRRWFAPEEAAAAVIEPELKSLLLAFAESF